MGKAIIAIIILIIGIVGVLALLHIHSAVSETETLPENWKPLFDRTMLTSVVAIILFTLAIIAFIMLGGKS